jgi:hypothetical protein
MFTAYKILTSFPAKCVYFAIIAVGTIWWSFNGLSWLNYRQQNEAEKTVAKIAESLRQKDPQAAAELAKLQQNHNVNALAATLKEREKLNGIDGVLRLAQTRKAYDLQLADYAVNPKIITADQRSTFLTAHGNFLQTIQFVQDGAKDENIRQTLDTFTGDYLIQLDEAAKDTNKWGKVRENPMMIFLQMLKIEPELLEFYNEEKDWLDDCLYLLLLAMDSEVEIGETVALQNAALTQEEYAERCRSILTIIKTYHPLFHDAVKNHLAGSKDVTDNTADELSNALVLLFRLFANDGQTIKDCVKNNLPLDDLLNIMLANPEFCEKHQHNLAAKLITIRQSMPNVWHFADVPFALQLAVDVPNLADELMRKYGTDSVAEFLYSSYDDALPQSAAAIDKFGDLAFFILQKYAESVTFKKYLKDNELGVRIIPYCAKFEDSGLERLSENRKWLDKYFDENGNQKEDEWWVSFPGGSLVKVAKNQALGQPSEWGELGWAALDVGDAALVVVSFGGSAVLTTGGKTAAKTAIRNAGRTAATSATQKGARALAHTAGISRIRTPYLLQMAKLNKTKQALHLVYQGGQWSYRVGRLVLTPASDLLRSVYASARGTRVAWQSTSR